MNEKPLLENILKYMNEEKLQIEETLKSLPDGYLKIYNSKNYNQWIGVFNGKSAEVAQSYKLRLVYKAGRTRSKSYCYYIPKKEIALARKLVLREYYNNRIAEINKLCSMIKEYTGICTDNDRSNGAGKHNGKSNSNSKLYCLSPEKLELIQGEFSTENELIHAWSTADYPTKTDNAEGLKYKSACGVWVRSRIEVIIADMLHHFGIPFRYEQRFEGPGGKFYPDFYIMNPFTGKKYVWEHFGLLDRLNYISNSVWKYDQLIKMGFIPGDTLLFTGESSENEVNMNAVISTVIYIYNDTDSSMQLLHSA